MAERTYEISGSDPPVQVTVRIGFPGKRASDGRYECGAEIDKGTVHYTRYMNGVDALEALQLAIIMIGTELKLISDHATGPLIWLGGNREDLGVPVYPDYSMNPIMQAREHMS